MNDFGQTILVLAIQLSFPLLGGLLLSRRRSPGVACSVLTASIIAVWGLTLLAVLPRPAWPAPKPGEPVGTVINESVIVDANPAAPAETSSPGAPLFNVRSLLAVLAVSAPTIEEPSPRLGRWLAAGFGLLTALGVILFLWESRELRRIVAESRPVADLTVLSELRELGARIGLNTPVSLRESSEIGGAATAGVRRPCVLLSPAWRDWSPDELRSALAHELAHIARRDFLTRRLGRLTRVIHGYHPLVQWLTRRQELCQELAADALAAGCLDDRDAYWRSLASLALKADARPAGMMPSLLGQTKTLFRRIAMLRVRDDRQQTTRRWPALLGVGLLSLAGLMVRGGKEPVFADPIVPVKFAEKAPVVLDHTYLTVGGSPNHVGVYAINVADLAGSPAIKNQIGMLNVALKAALSSKDKTLSFDVADLEQIGGQVSLTHDKSQPRPNRSLSNSLSFIRAKKPMNWKKIFETFSSSIETRTHTGVEYLEATAEIPALFSPKTKVFVYLPDDRTMVLESEENIKKMIDAKKTPKAKPAWADDWKAVHQDGKMGTLMMVLTEPAGRIADLLGDQGDVTDPTERTLLEAFGTVARKTTGPMTIGFQWGNPMGLQIRTTCKATDDEFQKLTDSQLAFLQSDANGAKLNSFEEMMGKVFAGIKVQRTATELGAGARQITFTATATEGVADLLKLLEQSK